MCPRAEGRCLALSHLIFIAESGRQWQGQASVTQLINPTRLAFLEITKDYAVNPDDMAFRMYGTLHHRRLEVINKRLEGLAEYKISQEISGTLDRLEPDELYSGSYKLIDYKLVGAYSVAKALGIQNGNKVDPDMIEWELQNNKYRIMVESDPKLSKLFPISRLFIQATIRDSGLKQIKSFGLPCRMPLIPVRKLDDDFVNEYFLNKDYGLHKALESGELPPMCDYNGRWGGRRCQKQYCAVHYFCPEGAMINRVQLEG
jgi:hypothetical protein